MPVLGHPERGLEWIIRLNGLPEGRIARPIPPFAAVAELGQHGRLGEGDLGGPLRRNRGRGAQRDLPPAIRPPGLALRKLG